MKILQGCTSCNSIELCTCNNILKNNYTIHEAKDFIMEENEQQNTITLPLVNGVPDVTNCGVEMLVSDDNVHWEKVFINFYDKSFDLPFRNDLEGFTYAKPLPKKITKQEAEKLLNNEFEIVD